MTREAIKGRIGVKGHKMRVEVLLYEIKFLFSARKLLKPPISFPKSNLTALLTHNSINALSCRAIRNINVLTSLL
jgi:hypothetical protein